MIDLRENIDIRDILLLNFLNLDKKEKEIVRDWRNNEEVRKRMYSDHIISDDEHERFIDGLRSNNKDIYWLTKDKKGNYLGVISLNRMDISNKNSYLGIYANPYNKVKGTGDLLIRCLIDISFNKLNLHSLKLEVIEDNDKAIRFYKRSGFSEEGRLREFVFKDGRWCDVIIMGIVNRNRK